MISRGIRTHLMCAHTHFQLLRSHKLLRTHPRRHVRLHFWRSTCGGDGTLNGYMVTRSTAPEIIITWLRASQHWSDYQIRLYRGNAEFAGYATYKYDVGART